MKTGMFAIVGAALIAFAAADCPNACTGNGICSTNNDFCKCFEGFTGADCSLRVCPFAPAFIDLPQGDYTHDNALNAGGASTTAAARNGVTAGTSLNPDFRSQGFWERHPSQLYGTADQVATLPMAVREDEGHFYSECAGVGVCDRSSGECNCFPGYGGVACNRTLCPGDCSGHGVCRTLADTLPADIEWYQLWETHKQTRCVCDAGFGGLDCSERVCPSGDDPLTTTTTRTGYNKGLAETAEVQYVDVKCKYGGTALDPMVAITYTDPDTMMSYATSYFDLSTATSSSIAALLKALPNDVLSDYTVDGTVINARLGTVVLTELESSSFWRIAITFDSSMGDVPPVTVSAHEDFFCKNALNVDTSIGVVESMENVAPDAVGDGPRRKLIYDVEIIATDAANVADTISYTVLGDNFEVLAPTVSAQTLYMDGVTPNTSIALPNAALFDREAALLKFYFEGGSGAAGEQLDVRGSSFWATYGTLRYHLTYDPFPSITVSNPTATLTSTDLYWRDTKQVIEYSNGTREELLSGDPLWFDTPTDLTPNYDMKITIRNSFITNLADRSFPSDTLQKTRAELLLNGEHIAFINGTFPTTFNGVSLTSKIPGPSGIYDYRVPSEFSTAVPNVYFANETTANEATTVANSSFVTFTPKTPLVVKSTGVDTINVAFVDNEAVNQSFVLVIKIVATSSNPDTYAWKFAGDSSWMDNGGAGFSVPSDTTAFHTLGDATSYLNARADDDRRWQATRIKLQWTNGEDYDQRVACSSSTPTYYYIQFGSNGLNDRPECADRGMCDESSGECSCFAGYTGPDCSEQNALARGGSRSSSA